MDIKNLEIINNLSKFLNENIKSVGEGQSEIKIEWEDECTESNNEDDFLMDIETVMDGISSDWVFLYDKTVEITQEHVFDNINNGYDIRAQIYTDDLCNINRIILIID